MINVINTCYQIYSLRLFHFYSLLTIQGTGYEVFIDNNGKLIVGILTKKEYFATSVSSPSLIDKKYVGDIFLFQNLR